MTVESKGVRSLVDARAVEAPLYFPSAGRSLFGWLCRPAGPVSTGVGLVICKPFGYEAIASHRSLREFAAAAARIGVPSLRFDYSGAGDSEDLEPGADQIGPWIRDIVTAAGELRRRTGVQRVGLLGFRLGALLAALAAAECDAVAALILVAPIVTGSRYVRELRMLQRTAWSADGRVPISASPTEQGGEAASDASIEAAGSQLSAASVTALSALDLTTLRAAPAESLLVIDRSDLPSARAWTDTMSALGAHTEYVSLPGFVEMMMRAPYFATVPQPMITVMNDWLQRLFDLSGPDHVSAGETTFDRTSSPAAAVLGPADEERAPQTRLTERAIFLDRDPLLFGVVTEPPEGEPCSKAVILLNDGTSHHVGSSRLHVSLARRWARRGCVVLRMDLAGMGDSDTPRGRPSDEVFPPSATADISAAVDFLRARYGVGEVTLAGLCSGAYHALRAAVAGVPVSRILLVNPRNFFWKQGTPITVLDSVQVVRDGGDYLQLPLSVGHWRRFFGGRIGIRRILEVCVECTTLALKAVLRVVAPSLSIRLLHDLSGELEGLGAAGVRTVFVFARGERGLELLRAQGGSAIERLGERCRVHVIDGADHVFNRSREKAQLEAILSAELFAALEPPHSRGRRRLRPSRYWIGRQSRRLVRR